MKSLEKMSCQPNSHHFLFINDLLCTEIFIQHHQVIFSVFACFLSLNPYIFNVKLNATLYLPLRKCCDIYCCTAGEGSAGEIN